MWATRHSRVAAAKILCSVTAQMPNSHSTSVTLAAGKHFTKPALANDAVHIKIILGDLPANMDEEDIRHLPDDVREWQASTSHRYRSTHLHVCLQMLPLAVTHKMVTDN